jgi:25S rRNA (uracil2634-N3)-methyltransferase
VKDFFRSASLLVRPDGEVHVSHKTKNPYRKWNLEELASEFALFLVEQVDFRIQDYPGYNNKRGDGLQCDQPFLLGKCSTFKFKIGDIKNTKRVRKLGPTAYSGNSRNAHFSDHPIGFSPFSPALPLLVPEMPQAYVPFHMPSVPVSTEFFVHEAVSWYRPAEAGMWMDG